MIQCSMSIKLAKVQKSDDKKKVEQLKPPSTAGRSVNWPAILESRLKVVNRIKCMCILQLQWSHFYVST